MAKSTVEKKKDIQGVQDAEAYNPSELEQTYVDHIISRKWDMDKSMKSVLDDIEKNAHYYENVVTMSDDNLINVNLPKELEIVETKTADELRVLPEARIVPIKNADITKVAALSAIDEAIDIKTKMRLEKLKALYYKNIFGTAIMKEHYKITKRKVKNISVDPDTGDVTWKTRDVIEYKDCASELIDLRNFRIDEQATSMEDANETIEMRYTTYEDAEADYGDNSNFKYVQKGQWAANYMDDKQETEEQKKRRVDELYDSEVVIWEYYRKDKDEYAIIINGVLMTKVGNPNPYDHKQLPYVRWVDHYTPMSFFGKGEIHVIKALKLEKNIIRNAALRTGIMNSAPPIVVPKGAGLDEEDFVFEHGAVWEVSSPEHAAQTRVLQVQGEIGSLLQVDAKIDEDIVTATGVDSRALVNAPSETATKSAIVKETAMKRINLGMAFIEEDSILRQKSLRLQNIKQFYKDLDIFIVTTVDENGKEVETKDVRNRSVTVSGISFKWTENPNTYDNSGSVDEVLHMKEVKGERTQLEVRPPLLDTEFDIQVIPASTLPFSKAFEMEQAMQQFQVFNGDPLINQIKLREDVYKAWDKDPTEFVIPPEPQQPPQAPQAPGGGEVAVPQIPQEEIAGNPLDQLPQEAL